VAVEAIGSDLANSFRGQGRRAVEATTVEFLRNAVVQRERPELVVMDPPRAGVGAEVCSFLARISPPEIVYVSCDPVTLARDLKMLVEAGYNMVELHLVDLFPQTFHLETVVVLRR
jgi:23S rRNA (uracil1939-C5)-methyltransferase